MKLINPHIKKLLSSSGINFLFRIFGLGTSFFIVLLISRLFGVANYGGYSLTFTIAQATAMIFGLGIPNALINIKSIILSDQPKKSMAVFEIFQPRSIKVC